MIDKYPDNQWDYRRWDDGVDRLYEQGGGGIGYGVPCEPQEPGSHYAEFDITTDPTEAPADALFEQADIRGGMAWLDEHRNGWFWISQGVGQLYTREWLGKQWCPDDFTQKWHSASGSMDGTCAYTLATPAESEPCQQCNGSGRVDGFLGVGIQIPCGECGGEGSR